MQVPYGCREGASMAPGVDGIGVRTFVIPSPLEYLIGTVPELTSLEWFSTDPNGNEIFARIVFRRIDNHRMQAANERTDTAKIYSASQRLM